VWAHILPKCYGMEKAEKNPNSISPQKIGMDPPNSLDSQLGRAKLGDSAAFAQIYDQYAARIYGFASHMVRSREDAEDITQDTFLLAFRNLRSLRKHGHFEQWLYRIARNEIYKRQRKAKHKSSSLEDSQKGIPQILRSEDPAGNPESRLLSAELGNKVKAIFHTLPLRYRETLVLATLQGLSYQAICQIQGRSLSSVKTDVYRARLLMSEKMQKYSNL
jgi:RNA polymerase sigma-70 factor (ECF subfamily)